MNRPEFSPRLDFDELQYEQVVHAGIAAVKNGDYYQARTLLFKAIEMKSSDPEPWIWLSKTTNDPQEKREYLEYALVADPGNGAAKRGLVLLSDELDRNLLMAEGASPLPRREEEPEEAQVEATFMCPKCGAYLFYDPDQAVLRCQYCSYQQYLAVEGQAEKNEQVLDFVLPTTRGHRWAEAQHRLSCSQCGAVTILPPGEKTSHCAYCASAQLIESAETIDLVDPQVIVMPKLDANQAAGYLQGWLGKGFFTPDDLKKLARPTALHPAYYPFWTFDGTCHMDWSCEVNTGSNDMPVWVMRDGVEFEMFDDVLVPGLRALESEGWSELEPFGIKEGLPFDPVYLAGWLVLAYDIPLAEASLKARENVVRQLRHELRSRVEVGMEKRSFKSGGIDWSGMTFKHVLYPLWVGAYQYRGHNYRVLINGLNGMVSGQKPHDRMKVLLSVITVAAGIVVLLTGLLLLALFMGWVSF